jgi:hypothetical protein
VVAATTVAATTAITDPRAGSGRLKAR